MKIEFKSGDSPLSGDELANDAQFDEMVYRWNATERDYPSSKTIQELFEAQVEKTPHHTALVYEGIELTYLELNERANRIGAYLRKKYQIKPDDLIVLCLDRSEYLLIAILAVLKSGGAYVPIDPGYPTDRIKYMLSDTNAGVIITNEVHADNLKAIAGSDAIATEEIDSEWFEVKLASYDGSNSATGNRPDHLAYVIYTSGTTGKPKGVMVEHRGVINLITDLIGIHTLDKHTNIGCYSNYVFDAFVYEAFPALCNGNKLFLYNNQTRTSPEELNSYIRRNDIAVSFIPPAILPEIIKGNGSSLQTIFTGGEKFPDLRKETFANALINEYGLTETTVCSTIHPFRKDDSIAIIGRPIANTTAYVLDAELNPVPVGETGELYIGGVGVARGYLKQPELTNERFISNLFQTEREKLRGSNGRLYKTGDLVRYLADGNVEYIGRNDFQVKMRGYRIEPGEIESVILSYPGVRQSVVVVREPVRGNKYLAAYYISEQEPERKELLEYLRVHLPEYMVPSALVQLQKFPLTVNGKLDRDALPDPSLTEGSVYEAPVDDTEAELCGLYAEVLGLDDREVGVNDDFFSLGGDSILAMRLVSRINQVMETDVRVTAIFTHKTIRQLAAHLFRESLGAVKVSAPVVDDPELQVLSFAQERLWFIEKYEGGSNAYNIPLVYKLREAINTDSLLSALRTVVSRHEILRSVIRMNNKGAGYQMVLDGQSVPFQTDRIILSSHGELAEAIEKSVNHIFNLGERCPIVANLYSIFSEDGVSQYISIVIHHIAFDGWSTEIFLRELGHYYLYHEAIRLGEMEKSRMLELPVSKVQYKEYSLWQRGYLEGEVLEKQLSYWRDRLMGYEKLRLNPDKPRPAQISYSGADIYFTLDRKISSALREVAKGTGTSLYSVLLSGYYILLAAYSGQQDIVVGTPIANRHHSELSEVVGFFVNTLVLREQVDPEQELGAFISRVGQSVIEAQLYQDLPFEKLVAELGVRKDPSRHPVFQVMFGVQHFGEQHGESTNGLLEAYRGDIGYRIARFDLTTLLDNSGEAIEGVFNYATSLFTEETIRSYIRTYIEILTQIGDLQYEGFRDQRISALQYISTTDREQIIHGWNATQREYSAHLTLQELFELQVVRTPEKKAVVCGNRELTYRELNERANQLAHYLRERRGIQPGDLVMLCLERTEQVVIAILGVLKSGGAYVPMDPGYPNDRIKYMLSDTGAKVVFTTIDQEDRLKEIAGTLPVSIESIDGYALEMRLSVSGSRANPVIAGGPGSLAYVIYTSGTTGRPKGVMVEHASVNRLVCNMDYVSIDETDTILGLSDFVFDGSVFDIFGALLNGASLIISRRETILDFRVLDRVIEENGVSIFFITTALFNSLVEEDLSSVKKLKYILFGGEKVSLKHVQKFKERNLLVKLMHVYGPTETTTFATAYLCPAGDYLSAGTIPIGRPISNTTVYVLDRNLHLLPAGAVGELYIGGAGVARGYLGQPELTGRRFISNPFQTQEEKMQGFNGRLYRTGDLVRYLSDGNLEYVGRNDFQVKIRGYRIELEEIESRLAAYSGIKQCVLLAREHAPGDKYLAGYYVAEGEVDEDKLLAEASKELPEYMIPAVLVRLDRLPLTVNGKLDRDALPDPIFGDAAGYVAPRSELEVRLCGIYAVVLGLEGSKIGVHDDFFRLGGDSILAIRLVSRINQELKANLGVKDVFALKTIRSVSAFLMDDKQEYLQGRYQPFSLVDVTKYADRLRMEEISDIFPASYLQAGMLIESERGYTGTYHDVLRYRIDRSFDYERFVHLFGQLVDKHELLRARFLLSDKGYDCIIDRNIEMDVTIYENRVEEDLIEKERLRDLDITKGGIFRIIINLVGNQFDLIVSFHHAISDGWSFASLINEFLVAYMGTGNIRDKIDLRYGEFVSQELRALENPAMGSFWKRYLADNTVKTIQWSRDGARSEKGYFASELYLGEEDSRNIHLLAQSLQVSVDSVFMYAYINTLSRFLNQEDIVIGLVVNNRLEKEEGDKQFGLFLNTIPYRYKVDWKTEDHMRGILDVFNHKLELYHYKGYPYGKIKSLFGYELYQFAFNFVHFHIYKESSGSIAGRSGYERTSIPFALDVAQDGDSGFSVMIKAHDDVADQRSLDHFMRYYNHNLHQLIARGSGFNQLPEEDYRRMIFGWNATEREYPKNKTVQILFEEQVERTPDHVAVVYEDRQLTYRELNERANRLAHYLQERYSIRPNKLVALCLDRSEQMLIAILGVLKAGGAYVPMDPGYPAERMRYIIADTETAVVLAGEAYTGLLKAITADREVAIEWMDGEEWLPRLAAYPLSNPVRETQATDLIYVIYTSGTTGRPKGVMVENGGIVNRICWMNNAYPLSVTDKVLQKTPYIFDVSVWELLWAICYGASVVMARPRGHLDSVYMAGLIGGKQITIVHFVPSMLQVFEEVLESDAGLRKKVESIRYLFCSGEALGLAQVRKAHTLLPNAAVHNLYGPTEASIDVLSYDCSAKDIAAVLIGRPISNTAVYVLDGNNKPLPAGAAGELFIGGVGVARGYVGQPELTAERFISNPFQTEEERRSGVNSRLYRTGDLVRYLADGNLEYIGRNDSQVKIRGYRIELGEIEAAISSYEKVEQSVVVAKERIPGTKHLVGYYVSKRELDENELREYLIEHLPEYMVPTLLVHMERLPMTVNGKVDKEKLPDSWPATADTHDHPRNETEEKLSLFFGELLGLAGSKAGVNDDFFRLGGDSILALRLVAAIRREYSSEVPLEVIFSKRTIAKISAYLSGGDGNKLFPAITKVKHSLEIPLSLSQEEMISHTAVEKNASNADFILKIKGPLNVEILEQTFVKMVERHEILRTVLKGARANGENNQYFQEIMPFENWSMNYLHRSAFENDAGIVKYVENYIRFPFDLSNEYSIRVALVDHANGEFLLVVVFSEMAVDGWSISLLQRDLMEIYNSKLKGIEESVEETPVSYADFSLWQDKYLRGVVLDEQLQYWRGQLKNIRPLDLRTDHPRIPLTEAKAGRVFRNIEQSIAVEIAPFTLQHNQTKFTILMTAFNILLYKWSGQSDICVGTTIANRRMQELESVVGYFANKIIIRSYVDESLTFIEMANQTKEAFFNGLANQDIRLSEVQDSLNLAHDPTRNSTYQSHFSYENYPQQRNFHLSDVVIERDARFIAPPVHYDILMYAANPVKEFYSIVIDYNSSLFELTTISKMLDDYMKILGWALHSSSKLKEFLSE